MTTHTPGPWTATATKHRTIITSHDGTRVAECDSLSAADARLIAAAPEMYEALKAIMASVAGCVRNPEYEAARAAIARAEGK